MEGPLYIEEQITKKPQEKYTYSPKKKVDLQSVLKIRQLCHCFELFHRHDLSFFWFAVSVVVL